MTLRLIGAPFVLLGLIVFGIAAYLFERGGAMRSWPQVDGVIISSTVQASMTQAKDKWGYTHAYESCFPTVRYRYTVSTPTHDSEQLEGTRITSEPTATSHADADRWVASHPAGHAVQVYYDPEDPTSSVLEFKTSVAVFILGPLGAFFMIFGSGFVVMSFYLKDMPTSAAPSGPATK